MVLGTILLPKKAIQNIAAYYSQSALIAPMNNDLLRLEVSFKQTFF